MGGKGISAFEKQIDFLDGLPCGGRGGPRGSYTSNIYRRGSKKINGRSSVTIFGVKVGSPKAPILTDHPQLVPTSLFPPEHTLSL